MNIVHVVLNDTATSKGIKKLRIRHGRRRRQSNGSPHIRCGQNGCRPQV